MQPRIRYGMVGGGRGAFIGAVHRMAARLDDQYALVCGAFGSTAARSLESGAELNVARERVYPDYQAMFKREAALPAVAMDPATAALPEPKPAFPAREPLAAPLTPDTAPRRRSGSRARPTRCRATP